MAFADLFSALNVSASGLTAERFRMEVVANNIANANSTRTPQGGPYQRRDVVFSAVLNERLRPGQASEDALAGVEVLGTVADNTEFPLVYNPGHPDAVNGFVSMPNVALPIEMTNLITANRAYEANLKVLQAYRQQAELALLLVRV